MSDRPRFPPEVSDHGHSYRQTKAARLRSNDFYLWQMKEKKPAEGSLVGLFDLIATGYRIETSKLQIQVRLEYLVVIERVDTDIASPAAAKRIIRPPGVGPGGVKPNGVA